MKIKIFLYLLWGGMFMCLHASSQVTVTTINYANSMSGVCNIFGTVPSQVFSGVNHYPVYGGVAISNEGLILKSQPGPTAATRLANAYGIQYHFKPGYKYKVSASAWKMPNQLVTGFPQLNLVPEASLPTPVAGAPSSCDPVSQLNWLGWLGDALAPTPMQTSTEVQDIGEWTALQDANYLGILVTPGTSSGFVTSAIGQIVITETAPRFLLSPNSIATVCGASLSQTFTVIDASQAGSVTDYVWYLGPTPNGWLLNGAPAPDSIITYVPSLNLVADACSGLTPSNVSAKVNRSTFGFTFSHNTDTAVVSSQTPTYSINGSSGICGGAATSYTIAGTLPCNATVTWSLNAGANGTLSTTTGASTSLTIDGDVTLIAHINSPCGNVDVSKSITMTGRPPADFGISAEVFCQSGGVIPPSQFQAIPGDQSATYHWSYTSASGGGGQLLGSSSSIARKFGIGSYTVFATATNSCGSTEGDPVSFNIFSCNTLASTSTTSKVVISPNPASNTVKVSTTAGASSASKKQVKDDTYDIREIRIVDKTGILLRKQMFPAGTTNTTINVEGLKPDIYILQTGNGKTFDNQKLVISR